MKARGRRLKFTAVIALVVLALTGFSSGRHHSSRHGSGGGGGCSSSSQDHDSSSSTTSGGSYGSGSDDDSYDDSDDDDYGSGSWGNSNTRRPHYRSTPTPSSTGSSSRLYEGTAKLVSCATEKKPYATVEVTNPNAREGEFSVDVIFRDAGNNSLVQKSADVKVPAKGKATGKVFLYSSLIDEVDHCEVLPEAYGS